MRRAEYDVVLIGVGANSLPLCRIAKELGKVAIHLGGALQMMFGIRGVRWDTMPFFVENYNEFWKYPDNDETPEGAIAIEGACYWRRPHV